jgi:hypothetical protein
MRTAWGLGTAETLDFFFSPLVLAWVMPRMESLQIKQKQNIKSGKDGNQWSLRGCLRV